jgi:hypothetical protein
LQQQPSGGPSRIALDDQVAAADDNLGFGWVAALADRPLIPDRSAGGGWSISPG